ncbi:ribonuclease H-like domain-containing protein [Tanacetum coccineum]
MNPEQMMALIHGNPFLWSNSAPNSKATTSTNLTHNDLMTLQGLLAKLGCNGNFNTTQPTLNTLDPVPGNWNMNTGVNSHLNDFVHSLSDVLNMCIYSFVSDGDGYSILVTNSGHSVLPMPQRPLHLNNVLITPNIVKYLIYVHHFVRDNNCTVEFDAFIFSIKDFMTRQVLLRCDSTEDLCPVTKHFTIPHAFLISQYTWHQRLRETFRSLPCLSAWQTIVWVYPLVNKYDVLSKFVLFHNFVHTQFKCEIKSFQCDHGGKFDYHAFHKLFADNGIQFRFSYPRTS